MALVVVSGQPSSGKSTASAQLKDLLQATGLEVSVVDESSLQLIRNESYRGGSPLATSLYMSWALRCMAAVLVVFGLPPHSFIPWCRFCE